MPVPPAAYRQDRPRPRCGVSTNPRTREAGLEGVGVSPARGLLPERRGAASWGGKLQSQDQVPGPEAGEETREGATVGKLPQDLRAKGATCSPNSGEAYVTPCRAETSRGCEGGSETQASLESSLWGVVTSQASVCPDKVGLTFPEPAASASQITPPRQGHWRLPLSGPQVPSLLG